MINYAKENDWENASAAGKSAGGNGLGCEKHHMAEIGKQKGPLCSLLSEGWFIYGHRPNSALLSLHFTNVNKKGITASKRQWVIKKTVELNLSIYIKNMLNTEWIS